VQAERERLTTLAEQVGALVHDITSHQLAKEYADQAKGEADVAKRYTWVALGVAGVTALLTLVFAAIVVFRDRDIENALGKAALVIPSTRVCCLRRETGRRPQEHGVALASR
jgi:hypothetical protein